MHRFFVSPGSILANQVHFSPDQARQIRNVLRLTTGDEVIVLDGQGWLHRVTLALAGKNDVAGRIVSTASAPGEPAGDIVLCQAITRGERFEWMLQKGVELGVTQFWPMISRRTVRRSPGDEKWDRWQRIVREAAEQCGRGRLPALRPPISFTEAIAQHPGLGVLPTLAAATPARLALQSARWPITLFIGPEGGFDPEEVELARMSGVATVTLGPRTLRTETAAVALLTLVAASLGELDRPAPHSISEM